MTLAEALRGLLPWKSTPLALTRDHDGQTIAGLQIWTKGTAIEGKTVERLTITDSIIVAEGGIDSAAFKLTWGDVTFKRCVLAVIDQQTVDRHSLPACVHALHARVEMEDCVVLGGNSGIVCGDDSDLNRNWILPGGYATNCYGVVLYRVGGCMVRNNVILPLLGKSARGVQINGGEGGPLESRPAEKRREGVNNRVLNNLILAAEVPQQNPEFPAHDLTSAGLRSRYGVEGCLFQDNDVLALGGGPFVNAAACYIGHHPVDQGNRFVGNSFTSVVLDDEFQAKCLTLEDHQAAPDAFLGNWFSGNHIWLSTSGYDKNGQLPTPIAGSRFSVNSAEELVGRWLASVLGRLPAVPRELQPFIRQTATNYETLVQSEEPVNRHTAFYGSEHDGDEFVAVSDWPMGVVPSVERHSARAGTKVWQVQ